LLLPSATGCYSYRTIPAETANPGTEVALLVNDAGRVALGERIGPGALRIAGRVAEHSDSGFVVQVSEISYVDNRRAKWGGEPVLVPVQYVGGVTEKRFNKGRTWLTAGIASAALLAIALGADLIGGGSGAGDTKVPPGGGDDQ
jgi:hypothetical protein